VLSGIGLRDTLPIYSVLVCLLLIGGCAAPKSEVGDQPDLFPPRIIVLGDARVRGWDRPWAFGPIPTELQSVGDKVCGASGGGKAIGYHAEAKDVDANPIPGGGYFCAVKN